MNFCELVARNLGLTGLEGGGDFVAYLPELGGWCTGRSAFTGFPRSIFGCPKCQFGLGGFD